MDIPARYKHLGLGDDHIRQVLVRLEELGQEEVAALMARDGLPYVWHNVIRIWRKQKFAENTGMSNVEDLSGLRGGAAGASSRAS
jgi:hypothetical protein